MKFRWLRIISFAISLNGISFTAVNAEQAQVNTFVPLLTQIQDDIAAGEAKYEKFTYYQN